MPNSVTQVWRRPMDRRTSTQLTVMPSSMEKEEVDILSASCIADEEKEEVEALSASCIEDGEDDDMFAVATQEPGVVNETADSTVEKSFEDTDGGERASKEWAHVQTVADSVGLFDQETEPLHTEKKEEMFFHNLEKEETQASPQSRLPLQTNTSLGYDSALLGADTQNHQSSMLFGESTQVSFNVISYLN